jgi:hypothetical protein
VGPLLSAVGGIVPTPHVVVTRPSYSKHVVSDDDELEPAPSITDMTPPQVDKNKIPTITLASGYYEVDDEGKAHKRSRAFCSYCGWTMMCPTFTGLQGEIGQLKECQRAAGPYVDCVLDRRNGRRGRR